LRIVRTAAGKYQFGSKKIIAKIVNMKLLIRVGGGYMGCDEFIDQYGRMELMKQIAASEGARMHIEQEIAAADDIAAGYGSLLSAVSVPAERVGKFSSVDLSRIVKKTDAMVAISGGIRGMVKVEDKEHWVEAASPATASSKRRASLIGGNRSPALGKHTRAQSSLNAPSAVQGRFGTVRVVKTSLGMARNRKAARLGSPMRSARPNSRRNTGLVNTSEDQMGRKGVLRSSRPHSG
jgi:hypothetical protein